MVNFIKFTIVKCVHFYWRQIISASYNYLGTKKRNFNSTMRMQGLLGFEIKIAIGVNWNLGNSAYVDSLVYSRLEAVIWVGGRRNHG